MSCGLLLFLLGTAAADYDENELSLAIDLMAYRMPPGSVYSLEVPSPKFYEVELINKNPALLLEQVDKNKFLLTKMRNR